MLIHFSTKMNIVSLCDSTKGKVALYTQTSIYELPLYKEYLFHSRDITLNCDVPKPVSIWAIPKGILLSIGGVLSFIKEKDISSWVKMTRELENLTYQNRISYFLALCGTIPDTMEGVEHSLSYSVIGERVFCIIEMLSSKKKAVFEMREEKDKWVIEMTIYSPGVVSYEKIKDLTLKIDVDITKNCLLPLLEEMKICNE